MKKTLKTILVFSLMYLLIVVLPRQYFDEKRNEHKNLVEAETKEVTETMENTILAYHEGLGSPVKRRADDKNTGDRAFIDPIECVRLTESTSPSQDRVMLFWSGARMVDKMAKTIEKSYPNIDIENIIPFADYQRDTYMFCQRCVFATFCLKQKWNKLKPENNQFFQEMHKQFVDMCEIADVEYIDWDSYDIDSLKKEKSCNSTVDKFENLLMEMENSE